MKPTFLVCAAALVAAALAAPASALTLVETFDEADFAGWTSRWFGTNTNARPYDPFDLSARGTNRTGLSLSDGDYGPNGDYNSTATDIAFAPAFAATLTSFAFDVLSYNDQRMTVYDAAGRTLLAVQLPVTPFDPADAFPQAAYTRYTVNSTSGIGGFRFGPFGSDFNVGVDNLVAVTAVPEPATWALMIGGVALAGGALRRRRSARPLTA